jgi:hypothetical protein
VSALSRACAMLWTRTAGAGRRKKAILYRPWRSGLIFACRQEWPQTAARTSKNKLNDIIDKSTPTIRNFIALANILGAGRERHKHAAEQGATAVASSRIAAQSAPLADAANGFH